MSCLGKTMWQWHVMFDNCYSYNQRVLNFWTSSTDALYLYQNLWKYQSFRVIKPTKFAYWNLQRDIIIWKLSYITFLCTSSVDALYLYQVSRKYLKGFQSYWVDTICIRKFTKEHNSVKSVGGVMVLVLCILFDIALYFSQVLWKYR